MRCIGASIVALLLAALLPLAALPLMGALVEPTPAPAPVEVLKKGSRGEAVQLLQQRLIELGYLHDRADGNYGLRTTRAVIAFQREAGLKKDGAAGEETQAALLSDDAKEVRVWIAPSGIRYHARQTCRGLRNAKSTSEAGFSEVSGTRTPCILCYGRYALKVELERRAADKPEIEPTPEP